MEYRFATHDDLNLLAEWNLQLIRDEGHRNPMTVQELRERMGGWLAGEYKAVIFAEGESVAYALYKESSTELYLRQLFVRQDRRRQGIGRKAVDILRDQLWPSNKRLTVEVLTANGPAVAFWRSVGYQDYCLTLEIMPANQSDKSPPAEALPRGARSDWRSGIRSCTQEDFASVLPLLEQLWPDRRLNPTKLARTWRLGLQAPGHFCFCCKNDGSVVGLATLSIRHSLWQQADIAYISELVVDASHRGRGIGRALLDFLSEFAATRGCARLELDSGFHRLDAHRMYEHCGLQKRAFTFYKVLDQPASQLSPPSPPASA